MDEPGVDAGEIRTYTMTLENVGTGPAYDVELAAAHDVGIVPTAGTVTCNLCVPVTNPLTDAVVGYDVDTHVPVVRDGETLVITWQVEFTSDTDVRRNSQYLVTADTSYDTSPEDAGSYTGRPLTESQEQVDVTVPNSMVAINFVSDTIADTSPNDGTNLAVDEAATFEV